MTAGGFEAMIWLIGFGVLVLVLAVLVLAWRHPAIAAVLALCGIAAALLVIGAAGGPPP